MLPVPASVAHPPALLIELWDKSWNEKDEFISKSQLVLVPSKSGTGRVNDLLLPLWRSATARPGRIWLQTTDTQAEPTVGFEFALTPELCFANDASRRVSDEVTMAGLRVASCGWLLSFSHIMACNVPDLDAGDGGDWNAPYVRLLLLDDDGNTVSADTTPFVRNQPAPCWGRTLTLHVPSHISYPPSVAVEVLDKDWHHNDVLIGRVAQLPLDPSEEDGRGHVTRLRVPLKQPLKEPAIGAEGLMVSFMYDLSPELFSEVSG